MDKTIDELTARAVADGTEELLLAYSSATYKSTLNTLLSKYVLLANTTVNFNSSMTAAEMQALIDAQPKYLNGFRLRFQFADGNYNLLASKLTFSYFCGGILDIYGNSADSTASLTKNVIITKTTNNGLDMFEITSCQCEVNIRYIKFDQSDTTARYSINAIKCPVLAVSSCAFEGNNSTARGMYAAQSTWIAGTNNNYLNDLGIAILTSSGKIDVAATSVFNSNGVDLYALSGGIILYKGDMTTDSITSTILSGANINDDNGWVN